MQALGEDKRSLAHARNVRYIQCINYIECKPCAKTSEAWRTLETLDIFIAMNAIKTWFCFAKPRGISFPGYIECNRNIRYIHCNEYIRCNRNIMNIFDLIETLIILQVFNTINISSVIISHIFNIFSDNNIAYLQYIQ